MKTVKGVLFLYQIMEYLGIILGVVVNIPHVEVQTVEPSFDVPIVNVTAKAGETAILPCSVSLLGDHVVAWMNPGERIMTLKTRRIIDDQRITVERPYTSDWNLYIHGVTHEDSGKYMCQLNTEPVKIKYVQLSVLEPPKIYDDGTSTHVKTREGATVNITCNVTGVPTPQVSWYRRSSHNKHIAKQKIGNDGETLIIHNISRYCDDIYQCVAFNDIEPSASREIRVEVLFPPEVRLLNKRISQVQGKDTILECHISANPIALIEWKRNGKTIQVTSSRQSPSKYRTELYENDQMNAITVSLTIRLIEKSDFGVYRCEASNILGKDSEDMVLSELHPVTAAPTTESPTTKFKVNWDRYVTSKTSVPKYGYRQREDSHLGQNGAGPGYSSQEANDRNNALLLKYSSLLVLCCILLNIVLEVT